MLAKSQFLGDLLVVEPTRRSQNNPCSLRNGLRRVVSQAVV
jgi:hypothetical protein